MCKTLTLLILLCAGLVYGAPNVERHYNPFPQINAEKIDKVQIYITKPSNNTAMQRIKRLETTVQEVKDSLNSTRALIAKIEKALKDNNISKVDGRWLEWSEWSNCSALCGDGITTRTRTCVEPINGGKPCQGNNTQSKTCNNKCPVDGRWLEWSEWSICSALCGDGITIRTRTCVEPINGGKPCQGNDTQSKTCNNKCPVDGRWSEWSEWSKCSATCGDGIATRTRTCVEPINGGKPCQGNDNESKTCDINCPPIERKLELLYNPSRFTVKIPGIPQRSITGWKSQFITITAVLRESPTVNEVKEAIAPYFTNGNEINELHLGHGFVKATGARVTVEHFSDNIDDNIYCDKDGNKYSYSEMTGEDFKYYKGNSTIPMLAGGDCRTYMAVAK